MKVRALLVTLFLALCATSSVAAMRIPVAQERAAQRKQQDAPPLQELRRRWQQKSDAERRMLHERYQELQKLPPEKRDELMERARHVKELESALRDTASDELRRELEELTPEERRARWREHLQKRSQEMGRRMRDQLPPELRQRLENASPEERWRLMRQFREERSRHHDRAFQEMWREQGLSPERMRERMRELEKLPPEERERALMSMRRQMIERRIESFGLPPGIDAETWRRMKELPDEAFLMRLRALDSDDSRRGMRDRWRRGMRGDPRDRRDPRRDEDRTRRDRWQRRHDGRR